MGGMKFHPSTFSHHACVAGGSALASSVCVIMPLRSTGLGEADRLAVFRGAVFREPAFFRTDFFATGFFRATFFRATFLRAVFFA
jgi:hypothetical protein